jgi:DnaA-homolog protein
MHDQLTLGIRLRDEANFASFLIAENQEVVSSLRHLVMGSSTEYIYLWGGKGAGKSHLLQACCQLASNAQLPAFYLSLGDPFEFTPQVLENLDDLFLVCIDNIHMIAGLRLWEEALFHFFNRSLQKNSRLLIAGKCIVKQLTITLPDLESRLSSGVTYYLKQLSDAQKLTALQLRANIRGFELTDDVGKYLLNHYPRDLEGLFNCLEVLDQASLKAKHRLTVPFVRSVLKESFQ